MVCCLALRFFHTHTHTHLHTHTYTHTHTHTHTHTRTRLHVRAHTHSRTVELYEYVHYLHLGTITIYDTLSPARIFEAQQLVYTAGSESDAERDGVHVFYCLCTA